jgi:5-formyltetrahydrofolate cyclo-ligase
MRESKDKVRRKMIERRRAMTFEDVAARSNRIVETIRRMPEWESARQVLLYWPKDNEVDTRALVAELWAKGTQVLLPRCRPGQPGIMDIALVACEADLEPGSYSIMEPAGSCRVLDVDLDDFQPDLACIPGVAFDRKGFRVGYGGGYYDRLLESAHMGPCLKIGLCYAEFLVRSVPAEDWDRPVNAVCTEEGLHCR